jgi:hypothetical protein
VLYSKSLLSAAEDEAGEGFIVEVQNYRIEVLFGWFPNEHNILPFSKPQSYALLSTESKATDSANNKERLDVCHA